MSSYTTLIVSYPCLVNIFFEGAENSLAMREREKGLGESAKKQHTEKINLLI